MLIDVCSAMVYRGFLCNMICLIRFFLNNLRFKRISLIIVSNYETHLCK